MSNYERRLAYLHARPGREAALRAYCAEALGGVVRVVEPESAFRQGWFGPGAVGAAARQRAGDLMLLARAGVQLVSPAARNEPVRPLLGNHGGLAAEEMLVPLLAVRV